MQIYQKKDTIFAFMKILLVAATSKEVFAEEFMKNEILITGIGMVNSSIKLTQRLTLKSYDLIINMGIAGSFTKDLKIGEVVEVVQDEFSELGFEDGDRFSVLSDFNLNTKYYNPSTTNLKKVRSITVNTVHGNPKSINNIIKRTNTEIESMEGAAIFKVCQVFGIKCIQIRSISNIVELRDKDSWNIDLAVKNLNREVQSIISSL